MTLEKELNDEVVKWKEKLSERRENIELLDKTKEDFLKNLDSYISDANHFYGRKDLIRAFEAVIWSWAILELGLQFNILTDVSTKRP